MALELLGSNLYSLSRCACNLEVVVLLNDRFGLPVTCTAASAVADYLAAVDLLLSANTGAEELLERAIAADPDFALAQIALARLLQLRAHMPEAKAAAAKAKSQKRRRTGKDQHRHGLGHRRPDAVEINRPGVLGIAAGQLEECPVPR